jgi:hypothetical protein
VGDDGFKSGVEGFVDGIEPEETRVKTAEQSEIYNYNRPQNRGKIK